MDGGVEKKTEQEIRVQHIENAVNFLSHPKVRGSTESSKRSFLVGKGLTEAEINEAFRRVPQISSPVPEKEVHAVMVQEPRQRPARYSWTSVFLGLGFTAATVYSIKSLFGPTISNTMKSWRSSGADDDAQHGNDAEGELAKAVREQTEHMRLSLESLENLIRSQNATHSEKEDTISQLREEVRHLTKRLDMDQTSEVESKKAPVSYMEVLEMLEKGETPPGIRDDINDKPPDPTMSPPISKLKPVTKPWNTELDEGSSLTIDTQDMYVEGEATTPNRRDLSGGRAHSIYKSIESTTEKSPSVLVEKTFSRQGPTAVEDDSPLGGSLRVEGSLGRPMMKAWKPPPLPGRSLSSTDASSSVE